MLWLRQAAKRKLERGLEQEIDRWDECHTCGTGTNSNEKDFSSTEMLTNPLNYQLDPEITSLLLEFQEPPLRQPGKRI